jgi:hypothetical protein
MIDEDKEPTKDAYRIPELGLTAGSSVQDPVELALAVAVLCRADSEFVCFLMIAPSLR